MSEETTTQLRREGDPAFPEDTENDNSADSSSGEETTTDQTPSSEGEQKPDESKKDDGGEEGKEKPFNEDPRWIKREDNWKERFDNQDKQHADDMKALREEFTEKTKPEPSTDVKIPSWFGGDEDQWTDYQKHEDERLKSAEEKAVVRMQEKQTDDQKAIDDATEYMGKEIGEIENDSKLNPKGEKIDRNKLLKFVMDNELVDTQGRWNYRAGYKLLSAGVQNTKKEEIDEKKKLAGATTSEKGAEEKTPDYMTSDDFKKEGKRPW